MKKILCVLVLICTVVAANASRFSNKQQKEGLKELATARTLFKQIIQGDSTAIDPAILHAEKALQIGLAQPVMKDTLLGNAYIELSMLSLFKVDFDKASNYCEMAINAYEQELGRTDPATMGTKIVFPFALIFINPRLAFSLIQQGFLDNEKAPEDQKIVNIDDATSYLSMGLEFMLSYYKNLFRYALVSFPYQGQRYYLAQLNDWKIGQPLVGWFDIFGNDDESDDEEKENAETPGNTVVVINTTTFEGHRILPEDERPSFEANIRVNQDDPRKLITNSDECSIRILDPEEYRRVKNAYRDFLQHEN